MSAAPDVHAVETVQVELAERGYAIRVGAGLIERAGTELADLLSGRKAIVVADETVATLHLPTLVRSLQGTASAVHALTVPAGESAKSMTGLADLLDRILAIGIDRRTVVVALGGGVTGDLAGFAAAVALRGLDFVQIPTTLLAQVDSSVGGKTGVNTRHGKNLVGAFHQPRRVLIDTAVLNTLPRRELLAGYAEVVKYGAIGDLDFFEWLEANGRRLLDGDDDARRYAIVASCRAKAAVVAADERETAGGRRALLNFGHTFGHALEAMAGYDGTLLHADRTPPLVLFNIASRLGQAGAPVARRIPRHILRLLIAFVGFGMTAIFFWRLIQGA